MILSSDNKAIENKTYNLLVETKEAVEEIKQSSSNSEGYEILNSSILYPSQRPLDEILGAKIICRGYIGTSFTITSIENFFEPFTLIINEDTEIVPNYITQRQFILSVQLGNYHVKATDGTHTTEWNFLIDTIGKSYFTEYYWEMARFTANSSYTCNTQIYDYLYVTAIGGGGGGGGGCGGGVSTNPTSGGGGGGGAGGHACFYKKFKTNDYPSLTITIGSAGTGGAASAAGTSGGSTIVGNVITLAGGTGGKIGNSSVAVDTYVHYQYPGGAGGTGGAAGGKGGSGCIDYNGGQWCSAGSNGSKFSSEQSGNGGTGGKLTVPANHTFNYGGGPGGGGGAGLLSGSNGGNGGLGGYYYNSGSGTRTSYYQSTPTSGTAGSGYGSGGGGGGSVLNYSQTPGSGGAGKSGLVIIYSGVKI